jgi:hypothetical protein
MFSPARPVNNPLLSKVYEAGSGPASSEPSSTLCECDLRLHGWRQPLPWSDGMPHNALPSARCQRTLPWAGFQDSGRVYKHSLHILYASLLEPHVSAASFLSCTAARRELWQSRPHQHTPRRGPHLRRLAPPRQGRGLHRGAFLTLGPPLALHPARAGLRSSDFTPR